MGLVLVLKGYGGIGVICRRRIGRKLETSENRIDHVLVPLEEIGQQDLVLDQLRGVALQLGRVPLEQRVEALPGFRPVFPQERNLRQVKARVPKLRVGRKSLLQRHLGIIVLSLAHQDDTPQVLRLSEIRLTRVNRVEFLQGLGIIVGVKFTERFVVHRLEFRFGGGNICRRKGTENQDCNRREFTDVHARTHTSYERA